MSYCVFCNHIDSHGELCKVALSARIAKLEDVTCKWQSEAINQLLTRIAKLEQRMKAHMDMHAILAGACPECGCTSICEHMWRDKPAQPPAEPALMTHRCCLRIGTGDVEWLDDTRMPGRRLVVNEPADCITASGTSAADAESSARELRELILAWEKGKK